jgi:hypothetical protein
MKSRTLPGQYAGKRASCSGWEGGYSSGWSHGVPAPLRRMRGARSGVMEP